jgi:hypothetical protein
VALSDDQKAMLRLLAQREQGYDDLASLMGLSVEEVRARVKEALEEIDRGESAPPQPSPPPPKASPPPPKPSPSKPAVKRDRPRLSLPANPRLRFAAAAAGGLALVLAFLLVVGVFGGGDESDSSEPSAGAGQGNGQVAAPAGSDQITQAMLSPVDGGDASGQALFGRIRDTAVLQVEAEGLEPSPPGQLYAVWLYGSPRIALRVGAVRVTDDGGISAQFPLPTEVLGYVAGGGFGQIDVSLTSNAAYRAEVAAARSEQRLPAYTGTSVLRGEITGRLIEAGARSRGDGG